jgi:hypothetical protein
MSFSNPNVKISYDGNGADDTFGINFYYLEGDEESVIAELWDYTDSNNPVKQSFVDGVDYTVDASAYPNTEVVTTAPVPVNFKIFIYRVTESIQTASFANGAFPAESVEEAMDRLMMVSQELAETLSRTITSPLGGTLIDPQDIADAAALVPIVNQNVIDIATNTAGIATNAGNIATNAGDIATNTGDIATINSAIGSIIPEVIVNITGAASHVAANKEIVIIDTSAAVDVTLPTPTSGFKITVKVGADITSKVINSAQGIDGFGTSYTVSSSYEAINLVGNGTQWYII